MAIDYRIGELKRLESVVDQEFDKLRSGNLKISTRATKVIANFVLGAVLDLIRRADRYHLDRVGDDNSSGEESPADTYGPGSVEDAIQAYRDLEDYYALTAEDDEYLFSQLSHPDETIQRRGRRIPAVLSGRVRILLYKFSNVKEWQSSAKVLIFLYIKLLSKELLKKAIMIGRGSRKAIDENDANSVVRIRKEH